MPNDNILAFDHPGVDVVRSAGEGARLPTARRLRYVLRSPNGRKDFNAGKADAVCSLFARDLRYDFRGYPERDYDDICTRLRRSLADEGKTYAYALDIREIIVSGDIAVVRLVWALTVTLGNGQKVTSVEPGMDVLRKSRTALGRSSATSPTRRRSDH